VRNTTLAFDQVLRALLGNGFAPYQRNLHYSYKDLSFANDLKFRPFTVLGNGQEFYVSTS